MCGNKQYIIASKFATDEMACIEAFEWNQSYLLLHMRIMRLEE